jgi:hypothetical protein
VDCFDEGRILSASEAERLRAALRPALTWVLSEPARAEDIVTRVLNNLINAYRHAGDAARVRETAELLRDLRRP